MSLFFQLFAGVPMNEISTFPLVPLGRWLFSTGIYLLMICFLFSKDKQNRRFVMIRYGWIQKWWKHHFLKNLMNAALAAVSLLTLFKIIDLFILQTLTGNLKETFVIFVLWTVHAMVLSALFLFMEISKVKKTLPAAILLLEGLTFLIGFRFRMCARFMFGTWGMYVQSNLYEGLYGFSIISITIVQATIIIICYWLGSYFLKRKEMEGV